MAKHSKEEILQILKSLAQRLGQNTLSTKDVASAMPLTVVNYYFGSLGKALEAAGLERTLPGSNLIGRRKKYSDDDLFRALLQAESTLGREPGYYDCAATCGVSVRPYKKRFGRWEDVLAHYRKWKADNPGIQPDSASGAPQEDPNHIDAPLTMAVSEEPHLLTPQSKTRTPGHFYGEPIDFRGLRHAPINEQGVVFLFGMVSRELGFNVEAIQQGFPDCEAKYLHDKKGNLWAKARIEFEYKASSFREHGHDPEKCDFVVCWINDWPECPMSVIELRKELLRLPSR